MENACFCKLLLICDWCVSIRWGRRSSRSGCCGSGWTAVLRRAGFWWPCRRAPGGGTTRLSLRWWRSGWTVTGSSPLVQLSLTERRKRRTKTSEEQSALLDTTTWPSCVPRHTETHKHTPLAPPPPPPTRPNDKPELSFLVFVPNTTINLGLLQNKGMQSLLYLSLQSMFFAFVCVFNLLLQCL